MKTIEANIRAIIKTDPSERKNIGTFTAIHTNPLVNKYLYSYLNKNLVDKKGYKSLVIFEEVIDKFFKELFEYDQGTTIVTSGSTESVLLAFHYAREQARDKRGITKPNMLIPEHAHYSLPRCARMLNIEVREVAVTDECTIDVADARKKVDENTILIVGVMGSTELGVIDDLVGLNQIAAEHGTGLHVDAAISGFVVPFLDTNIQYKFSQLSNLMSMNVSGHKFGLSLCGCGVLMIRDKKLIEKYAESIEYLSSGAKTMDNFMVTSSALGVFSMGTNIMYFGLQGYKNFAKEYMATKTKLLKALTKLGWDCYAGAEYAPQLFIYGDDIEKLSEFLELKGWVQHVYKAKGFKHAGLRVVIKKGSESRLLNEFLDDVSQFSNFGTKRPEVSHWTVQNVVMPPVTVEQ